MTAFTAEAANDMKHFVPTLNYAPPDGRGLRGKVKQSQAMQELVDVRLPPACTLLCQLVHNFRRSGVPARLECEATHYSP
jgi:hypothetical protein